jgi:putative intracellular protease/amidase
MIDRRSALRLGLLGPLAAAVAGGAPAARADAPPASRGMHDMSMAPPDWTRHDEIAMLVYPKMTALDLIGPQYMFASLMGAKVHLVAKSLDPVTSDTGVTIVPTTTFDGCPNDLTVLFAPGGTEGTLQALEDEPTRAFVADRGARATYVTSVCTGSLILGAAGLLKGYRATSHWSMRDILTEFGAIPTDARVVRDRNRITGAGVTAGLDFGLAMVALLRDRTYAQGVQLIAEYDPQPPFEAGSPQTAPAEVTSMMTSMFAPAHAKFLQAARLIASR